MAEFMLIYKGGDPEWAHNTSPEDMKTAMDAWGAWMGKLQEQDKLVSGGSPLHYAGKRMTKDGVVTDISASEFKELVSGYSIVSANNMDEALEITRQCPIFNHPNITVEVREVLQMDCSS